MNDLLETIRRIETLSNRDPRTLCAAYIKAAEEIGELAEEILIGYGECPFKSSGPDGINGESIDLLLCTMAVFFKSGGTIDELILKSNIKMDKWERDLNKRLE